jgi:hypothetical protein
MRQCGTIRCWAGGIKLLLAPIVVSLGCGSADSRLAPIERAAEEDFVRFSEAGGMGASFSKIAPDLMDKVVPRTGTATPRYTILESLGSGVAMLDYDQDGDIDIFVLGGGSFESDGQPIGLPPTLIRNDGQGHFRDATSAAALQGPGFYSHGVCVFDWDQDGFPDMLVTGFQGCLLYHNQQDGRFTTVTAAELGIVADAWFTSAASGDFNSDGLVDLYLVTYVDWTPDNDPPCTVQGKRDVCPPAQFNALPDRIYLGTKSGAFQLAEGPFQPSLTGKGLGVVAGDFDLDGDTDIYVANDTTPNALYQNENNQGFVETGLYSGTSLGLTGTPDGSMGVDAADANGDGLPDLWVTNFERESFCLYRNAGGLLFQNVSLPSGIGRLARTYVGFGTAFLDIDFDGFEDIYASNGHVLFHPQNAPRRQLPILLQSRAGKEFKNVAESAGSYFATPHTGRGAAIGDLDGDGDQDLAVTHADEPLVVLQNDGQPGRWLQLRLVGTTSHRDAVGAFVTLQTSSRQLVRLVKGGGSYLSASEKAVCFLLPTVEVPETLTIRWPSGTVGTLSVPVDGGSFRVVEGSDALKPVLER